MNDKDNKLTKRFTEHASYCARRFHGASECTCPYADVVAEADITDRQNRELESIKKGLQNVKEKDSSD